MLAPHQSGVRVSRLCREVVESRCRASTARVSCSNLRFRDDELVSRIARPPDSANDIAGEYRHVHAPVKHFTQITVMGVGQKNRL